MEVRHAYAARKSRYLGPLPRNWKGNRSVAEDAEIVAVVCVFPDVFAREHEIFPKGLLESGVELIAPSGAQRSGVGRGTGEQRIQDRRVAAFICEHQILIEGSLQYSRVGDAKHGIARLDVVGDPEARLGFPMGYKAIVEITAQANVESPVAFRDGVLGVKSQLFHVGVTVKCEKRAALRQIEGRKDSARIGGGLSVRT